MAQRTVLVAGATGLVGREILRGLLADPEVKQAHVLTRRPPEVEDVKLVVHLVDFTNLPPLPPADELYLALGTTIRDAGSRAAFRALDYDANLAVAEAALAAGVKRLGLVSAMGANAKSRVFYSRVKGELEEALSALPFTGVVIARPSLLVGDREELGQKRRPGEASASPSTVSPGFSSRLTRSRFPRRMWPTRCWRTFRRPRGRVSCCRGRCGGAKEGPRLAPPMGWALAHCFAVLRQYRIIAATVSMRKGGLKRTLRAS